MHPRGKAQSASGSSIGSAAQSATSKSSSSATNRPNQLSQRNNQYACNPVTNNGIEDAHKLLYLIKADQEQAEINKLSEDIDKIKNQFQNAKEIRDRLYKKKASTDQHSNALKKLYFARELEFIARILYGLILQNVEQIDRARIRLSDDAFSSIKTLVDRFRCALKHFSNLEQMKAELQSTKQNINPNVVRLCITKNFIERPKSITKECDYYRLEIRQLMQNIGLLKDVLSRMSS